MEESIYLEFNETCNCGIFEADGLENINVKDFIEAFGSQVRRPPAFVQFSDAIRYGNGERIYKGFKKNPFLGQIIKSPVKLNRNSGNRIAIYTWMPSKTVVDAVHGRAIRSVNPKLLNRIKL